jgi:hypothetical protein
MNGRRKKTQKNKMKKLRNGKRKNKEQIQPNVCRLI